ncbi:hypothetical protein IJ384_06480 [bacterium]|nr:hypothetical protein [bacterium]
MNRKSRYKDLEKYRKTTRNQKRRYYGKTQNAKNGGKCWSLEEIELILKQELSDTELSTLLGRSVAAIQIKRQYYRQTQNTENSGKRWNSEEIELILKQEISDTELSALLGRSVAAIQIKRGNIKKNYANEKPPV